MCISYGVECFGRCGCNDTSTEDFLNELEKKYKGGFIESEKVKKEIKNLLDTEDYIRFLDDLGIECEEEKNEYYFDDRDYDDNKIIQGS